MTAESNTRPKILRRQAGYSLFEHNRDACPTNGNDRRLESLRHERQGNTAVAVAVPDARFPVPDPRSYYGRTNSTFAGVATSSRTPSAVSIVSTISGLPPAAVALVVARFSSSM